VSSTTRARNSLRAVAPRRAPTGGVHGEAIAPDIDLAILKLVDTSFFEKHSPLPWSKGLPKIRDTVHVAGYPQGGETLSLTRGIVSRIEYTEYYYNRSGVRVQIDAAVNPGNSGGPAIVDGKLIGIVFSTLDQSENIGYLIPIEEIELFLADIKDGTYDGKPFLYDLLQYVQNDALRAELKLPKGTNGMMVLRADREEASHPLKVRDVVTKIGDHEIDSAGKVEVEGGLRLYFEYYVQSLAKDGKVRLSILRDGMPMTVDVPVLTRSQHPTLTPYLFNGFPSYLVWGPLVFSPASADLIQDIPNPNANFEISAGDLARQHSPLLIRNDARPAFEGEQLVVLTTVLPHHLVQGYRPHSTVVVKEVDGVKVRNLSHLAACLRDAKGERVVITFFDRNAGLLVLNRQGAIDAAEEIQSEYGIRKPYSDDLKSVFEGRK
jgi:hypothetical protein